MDKYQNKIKPTKQQTEKNDHKKTNDPRKNPRSGYDEKNPSNKKDIEKHPENQNTG